MSVAIFEACYQPAGHMDNGQPLALADGYEDRSSDQQSDTSSIKSLASATKAQQKSHGNKKERRRGRRKPLQLQGHNAEPPPYDYAAAATPYQRHPNPIGQGGLHLNRE